VGLDTGLEVEGKGTQAANDATNSKIMNTRCLEYIILSLLNKNKELIIFTSLL
jgi:hypothetical protein